MINFDVSKLEVLLNGIKEINEKYPPREHKKDFNLFKVIRKGHEEVTLHSKFLFELLDPNGSHGVNNHFLNLFIKEVNFLNPDFNFNTQGARAYYEKQNIDLLIQNHSQAIIIENKIFAGDQPNQIYRYCDLIYGNGIKDVLIIYLTLNGKTPSDQSISCPNGDTDLMSDPEKIKNLISNRLRNYAYESFIISWLDSCMETIKNQFTLYNTIEQYKKLLIDLTQSKEIEEREELVKYLGNENLMLQAHYIVDNWNHVKWHVEMSFWDELQFTLPKQLEKYNFNSDYNYSVEDINKSAHYFRKGNQDYGIALNLFEVDEGQVFFMIHRGPDSLSYGIRISNTETSIDHSISKPIGLIKHLEQSFSEFTMGEVVSNWIQWRYIKPDINFEEFKTGATLSLANPEKRKNLIADLWEEMSKYIYKVLEWQEKKK